MVTFILRTQRGDTKIEAKTAWELLDGIMAHAVEMAKMAKRYCWDSWSYEVFESCGTYSSTVQAASRLPADLTACGEKLEELVGDWFSEASK